MYGFTAYRSGLGKEFAGRLKNEAVKWLQGRNDDPMKVQRFNDDCKGRHV